METRILLIRHAETSSPGRFHGAESDVGLSDRGRSQARFLADHLRGEGLAGVASSGMRRAIATAEPLAEVGNLPLRVVESLHERRMPSLSGRTKPEGMADYEATLGRWMAGDIDHAADVGDESYRAMTQRVVPVFLNLAREFSGRSLALVVHGLVLKVLMAELVEGLGLADLAAIGIDHCAPNDLRFDGQIWTAVARNAIPEGMP